MKRLPLILNVLAVAVLAASSAYWALQLYKPEQRPIAAPPPAMRAEPPIASATGLFGGAQVAAVASNFQLTGVVAAGSESVAIIVADGNPAKAVQVGREVAPGVILREVHPRYVMLSDSGVAKRIELAKDVKPAAEMAQPTVVTPPPAVTAPPPPQPVAIQTGAATTPATPATPMQQIGAAPPPSVVTEAPATTSPQPLGQGQVQPQTQQPRLQAPPPAFAPGGQPVVRMPPPVQPTGVQTNTR